MNTPNQETRDFKISDNSMLQDSRTTQQEFVTDAATFKAFDADFITTYKDDWLTAVDDATNATTDEQVVDVQTGLTDDVEAALEDCKNHFQTSKYYIEKAFANKPAIWNEFGYDNYDDVRKSPEKMIVFMSVFNTVANNPTYKTALLAAGYTQANIDAIDTKRQTLIDTKINQELGKNSRLGNAQSRIILLNKVWAYRTAVAKAAKNIFANDFARYKVYLLPASAEGSDVFDISGTVTEAGTGKKLENVTVDNSVDIVTTDSNGKYGFAQIAEGDVTLKFNLAGYTMQAKNITFGSTAIQVDVEMVKV